MITRGSSCLPWCSGGGREYGHYLCGTLSRACLKWLQLHCPAVPTEGPGLVGSAVHNIKRKWSPHLWILKYCFTFFKVMLEPKKACLRADLALQSPFCGLWHLWFYNVCTCFHFSVFIFCTSSSVEYPGAVESTQKVSKSSWPVKVCSSRDTSGTFVKERWVT